MKQLREKMGDAHQPVIFYELLPPNGEENGNLEAYVECAIDLLTSSAIRLDALNIPDIREEDNNTSPRAVKFFSKINPWVFAKMLSNATCKPIDVILSHCTVYEPIKDQIKWLNLINEEYNINGLILVGGSNSKIAYPGPSVLDMSNYIQSNYTKQFFCGGITIQSRRYRDDNKDEPYRLLMKGKHGLEYFTSQIIYEAVSIKLLLRDYYDLCKKSNISPKRILLSFAPISNIKDLEFLRWLGVIIPKSVETELFKANIGIGWRSAKIALTVLQDILHFMEEEDIQVPIGLNIEHITRHNFELSLVFLNKLGALYNHYVALKK